LASISEISFAASVIICSNAHRWACRTSGLVAGVIGVTSVEDVLLLLLSELLLLIAALSAG